MKRTFKFLAIVFMMGFIFLNIAEGLEKVLIRVRVMVQADADIQSSIESQLKRDLRALGDVILVNENPDFEIRVIAMESMTKEKEKTGIAFATVFLRPYVRSGIPEMISSRCKGDPESNRAAGHLQNSQIYRDHLLQIGSPNDIEQICKDIVYTFKTNVSEDHSPSPPSRLK